MESTPVNPPPTRNSSGQQMAARIKRGMDQVQETFKNAEWRASMFAGIQILDQLAHKYVLNAFFVDIGLDLPLGTKLTLSALMSEHNLDRGHQQLIAVCLDLLQMDGILKRDSHPGAGTSCWIVVGSPPSGPAIRKQLKQLQTNLLQFPECKAEGLLLVHMGSQLGACFTGKASGIALMFPPADSWQHKFGAWDFYQNSQILKHTKMAYIEEAVGQIAVSKGDIRILEIGAGTGSTTLRVLEKLVNNSTAKICYTFTDISSFFVSKAKPRFEALFPTVEFEFRVLDIENDPVAQGFGENSYDVVIAGDVLHATQSLHDSVAHTRRLLKDGGGGWLVLAEIFEMAQFFICTFGLTDGWWRYADERSGGPVVTPREWTVLLEQHGFAAADVLHVWECAQGVVVAQTQ